MIQYPKRYAIYDTETTGLLTGHDEIVELAVKIYDKDGTFKTGSWILLGDRPSCPEALNAHKITEERRRERGIDPKIAFQEFIDLVGDRPFIGHNAIQFDNPMLWNNLFRSGFDPDKLNPKFKATVDTAALYKARKLGDAQSWYETHHDFALRVLSIVAPGLKFNLKIACQELGIDVSDLGLHSAAGDVEAVSRLYNKLIV